MIHNCFCDRDKKRADNNIKIALGKDIHYSFAVEYSGTPLSERDLVLEIKDKLGNVLPRTITIDENVVSFDYLGTEQKVYGEYRVRLWENRDKAKQSLIDIQAFELVRTTEEENISSFNGNADMATAIIEGIHVTLGTTSINLANAKSAYDAAREKGFTGTEEEFNEILANAAPVNDLDTDSEVKPLSAAQGKVLNEKIERMDTKVYILN